MSNIYSYSQLVVFDLQQEQAVGTDFPSLVGGLEVVGPSEDATVLLDLDIRLQTGKRCGPSNGQWRAGRPLRVRLIGHSGLEQPCLFLMPPDELKANRRAGSIQAGRQDNRRTAG